MIFYELTYNPSYYQIIICESQEPIMFARFICTVILHLSLTDEVTNGLKMMKYACNHPYRFNLFEIAWMCGFMQMTSSLGVELSNIGVILAANDTISIVFNFIAVAIIAEFDNYVFHSMKSESFKQIIEPRFTKKALPVCHTTSKKCQSDEMSNQIDPETGELRPLKIFFNSRTMFNKVLFVIYKWMRCFYVSVFYYFLPFLTIILSTMLPTFNRSRQPENCSPY